MGKHRVTRKPSREKGQKPIVAGADGQPLLQQLKSAAPEAFAADGHVLNLVCGEWSHAGHRKHYASAVDGSELGLYPMLGEEVAKDAVHHASGAFSDWSKVDLDERKRRVQA